MTWGDIKHRAPETCLRCGAAWMALILLQALHEGQPLEWFSPDAEPGAAPDKTH